MLLHVDTNIAYRTSNDRWLVRHVNGTSAQTPILFSADHLSVSDIGVKRKISVTNLRIEGTASQNSGLLKNEETVLQKWKALNNRTVLILHT